ncbi:MAG: mechanosensitive ion channel family protein [Rhizobiaceae bacterium]
METAAQDIFANIETGLDALMALVVSYSFSVLGALILMVGGYFVAGLMKRGVFAGLGQVRNFDVTLRHFFANTARYAILILVLVMVLGQFGVQTASIIAAIGAIGLAIGLALQGTLQNIAAGIMLLVLRPFRIGEDIEVGNIEGTVEEIGLFATRLRRSDGIYVLSPNSKLWNEPVRNFSRNRMRRNDIAVMVRHDTELEEASGIMVEVAKGESRVKKAPPPISFPTEINENGVRLTLRYWTTDKDWFGTKIELTRRLQAAFKARGVAVSASPTEMVLRNGSLPKQDDDLRGQATVGRA